MKIGVFVLTNCFAHTSDNSFVDDTIDIYRVNVVNAMKCGDSQLL